MAKKYLAYTVLLFLFFLVGSGISHALTPLPQITLTPTPQEAFISTIYHPIPNFSGTLTREEVEETGVALQARLGMWDISSSVTINARNDILVSITSTENTDFILENSIQRGLIELIHLNDVMGAHSILAMLDQPLLPEHYFIPLSGDVFRSVQVEMNTPGNWSVIFDYVPDVALQHQQFVEDHPADFFGVVVDEVMWSVISVAGTRISGLSEQKARVLAAYMQSGPLPLLIEQRQEISTPIPIPDFADVISQTDTFLYDRYPESGDAQPAAQVYEGERLPVLGINPQRMWVMVYWHSYRTFWINLAETEIIGDLSQVPEVVLESPVPTPITPTPEP